MQPLTVVELDFLPNSYRQQTVRRRDRRWRAALVVVVALLLGGTWFYRVLDHRAARRNFEMLAAAHESAVLTQQAWEAAQKRRDAANRRAALVTYLKHPFATSQTLAAVIVPLPESLRLAEIKIVRETLHAPDGQAPPRRGLDAAADAAEARLPPAERDLARLRREYDSQQIVVLLGGEALDGEDLHRYIRRLAASNLFARAELTSLQRQSAAASDAGATKSQFQARAILRPSIGQPGGLDAAKGDGQLADAPDRPAARAAAAERQIMTRSRNVASKSLRRQSRLPDQSAKGFASHKLPGRGTR